MPGVSNTATQGMSSMMIVLMVVGIGTLLAGLLTIAYGIWIELSYGNSLVVAGTVAACSGLVLLGLCAVVTELKIIARRLADPRSGADARMRVGLSQITPAQPAAGDADDPYSQVQTALEDAAHVAPQAAPLASPQPGHEAAAVRGQPEAAPEPAPAPPPKPRRNLLFSSHLRKDRERTAVRVDPPVGSDPQPAPPLPGAAEPPSPPTFDDAWPKPERSPERAPERASERPRAAEALAQRRGARGSTYAAATNGSAVPERQPPSARAEEPPAVTVLKSGVVDGMAYSLYSDGSIEAQMPEGMMRFASIDELRTHLDNR
jgi:hypothetical protein